VVVVTGGGTGIGLAIARAFAEQEARVIIVGRREPVLLAAAQEIGAIPVVADVGRRSSVEAAVAAIRGAHDHVDVLVNNAGSVKGLHAAMGLTEAEEVWEHEIRVNLTGPLLMSIGLAPLLRRPGGRIINLGSIAAYTGGSKGGNIGYAAAKSGVQGLTIGLARDLASQGITVNAVAPGLTLDTEFFGKPLSAERVRLLSEQIPVGRGGRPEDVAAAVLFLASEQAAYITGQVLHVNGGWLFAR
jgi:3-oxoacyl-[acyl-carrier protein] reductase